MNRWGIFGLAALLTVDTAPLMAQPSVSVQGAAPLQPDAQVMPGTGTLLRGPETRVTPGRTGDIALNYPNVDVHEVAKAILGDLMGLNYSVEPGVSGTVMLVTAEPVRKSDVLPTFEAALEGANLALVKQGAAYVIKPLAAARKQAQLIGAGEPGYGTEALPLRFVNSADLKKLLEPLMPEGGISQVDPGRNLLFITGTSSERDSMRRLVTQFDVNWMRGMSFALFVPHNTDSRSMASELNAMLNTPGMPASSVVRLLSLERLNAVMAISASPQYLDEIRKWVAILDRPDAQGERKLFVYRVQNGRAADLAKTLSGAFGGGNSAAGPGGLGKPAGAAGSATPTTAVPAVQTFGAGSDNGSAGGAGDMNPSGPQLPESAGSQSFSVGTADRPITISSDETNNSILVYATARQYSDIQDALAKLDILPLQVMLEAAIAEVTLDNNLRYGVQWYFNGTQNSVSLSQGTTAVPAQSFPGFSYLYSNGNSITATLNALSDVTTVRVVSAPKLLVLNNHTASLQVGDEVPVQTQSSVGTQVPGAPVISSIEYRDTGVILKVTPHVNDSGMVLLDIAQEVSDVSTNASSDIDSPTIEQRRISTSVVVRDHKTIALGGMIKDTRNHEKTGLPYLNTIPILGNLFGGTDNKDERIELVVLLTPTIERNPEEAETVTQELQRKLKTLQPMLSKDGSYDMSAIPGKAP